MDEIKLPLFRPQAKAYLYVNSEHRVVSLHMLGDMDILAGTVRHTLVTTDQAEDYTRATIEPYRKALHDLIRDFEMRSNLKEGRQNGVVDCGNGVYMQALRALGELDD